MTHKLSLRLVVAFAAASCVLTTAVFAQGVAGGLVTFHTLQSGPQIVIGTAATPIPIDLDPTGSPWFKNVGDPNLFAPGLSIVDMFETMVNVGTEAWGDWHEILLPAPAGLAPHTWTNVLGLTVNNNPITFTATGLGTQTLNLFNFSQPVQPGDIFSIHKRLNVNGTALASGAFLRIQEFPTPSVPEPGCLTLVAMAISGLSLARRRSFLSLNR